jgi:hypothetical protein
MTIRVAILGLAFALAGCVQPLEERRFVEWRLEDDLAAFREQQTANPEHLYRVGELSDALHGPPYQRFLEVVAQAPAGERAFVYYEVSGANGIWFFALAVDGRPCRIVTSDYDGVREYECRGFSTFEPVVENVRTPVRDGLVAGLVQYEPGQAPVRAMDLVRIGEPTGVPQDGDLIGKVRRVFTQGRSR